MANGKRYGKSLPSPANTDLFTCFSMIVPDKLQYRAALMGQLNFLGLWFAWDHENDGIVPPENETAAQLWVNAAATASFEVCMEFCERIIDCIATDADVRASIVNALKSDPDFNQWLSTQVYRLTEGQITGILVPGDCDNSVVAGRALALVERLDTNNTDFLEMVETGTNDEERISEVLEAIPVLDEAPVGDVIGIINSIMENFAENYASISTTGRREAMAREIYCLMLANEDCSITFEQLFEYFQMKATSGLTILSTVFDVAGFIVDGDFDNDDAIWYGMFALQTSFVLTSRDFFGVDIGTMAGILRDASPSSIWEEWDPCDDPSENCLTDKPLAFGTILFEAAEYTNYASEFYIPDARYIFAYGNEVLTECDFMGVDIVGGVFTPVNMGGAFSTGFGATKDDGSVDGNIDTVGGYPIRNLRMWSTTAFSVKVKVS